MIRFARGNDNDERALHASLYNEPESHAAAGGSTNDKPEDYKFMCTHSFVDPKGYGWELVHLRAMPAQE